MRTSTWWYALRRYAVVPLTWPSLVPAPSQLCQQFLLTSSLSKGSSPLEGSISPGQTLVTLVTVPCLGDNSPASLFTRASELFSLYPGHPFRSGNVPDLGFKRGLSFSSSSLCNPPRHLMNYSFDILIMQMSSEPKHMFSGPPLGWGQYGADGGGWRRGSGDLTQSRGPWRGQTA